MDPSSSFYASMPSAPPPPSLLPATAPTVPPSHAPSAPPGSEPPPPSAPVAPANLPPVGRTRPPKARTAPAPHDLACLPPLLPPDRLSWAPTPTSLLGSGTYGAIYRGTLDGATPVAVKLIRRRSVLPTGGGVGGGGGGSGGGIDGAAPPSTAPLTPEARKAVRAAGRFATEVATYARLSHPCLVQFVGIASAYRSAPSVPSLLVMEYMAGGSLAGGLATARAAGVTAGGVPLPTVVRVLADVAAGVAYLHGQSTLHGRLSATNILLTEPLNWDNVGGNRDSNDGVDDGSGGDDGNAGGAPRRHWSGAAKVADFALARCMDTDADDGGGAATALHGSTMNRTGGALRTAYVPPEAFSQRVPRWERDLAADVYAWGVLAQELLTVQPPWAALIAAKGAGGSAPAIAAAVQAGERPPWGGTPTDGPAGEVRALADAAMGHAWRGRPLIGALASAIEALAGRLGVARTGAAAVPSAPPVAAGGGGGGGRGASRSWTASRWDMAERPGATATRPPSAPSMSPLSPPEGVRATTPPPPMAPLAPADSVPPFALPASSSLPVVALPATAPSAPPAAAARSAKPGAATRGGRPPAGPTARGGAWLHMDIHGSLAEEYARFEQEETTEDRRRASVLLGQDEGRVRRDPDGRRRHTTGGTTGRGDDGDDGARLQPVVSADDILSAVSLVNTMSEEHGTPTDSLSATAASQGDDGDADSDGGEGRGEDVRGSAGGITGGYTGSPRGGAALTTGASEVASGSCPLPPGRRGVPRGTTWAARSGPEGDNGLADTTARGMLWGWLQERVDGRDVGGGGSPRATDSLAAVSPSPRAAKDAGDESPSPPPSPVEVVVPVTPTPPQVVVVTSASPPPQVVVVASASSPPRSTRTAAADGGAVSSAARNPPRSTSPPRSTAAGTVPSARTVAPADEQAAAPWWTDRPSGRPWPTDGSAGQGGGATAAAPTRQGTPMVTGRRRRRGAAASAPTAPSEQPSAQSPPRTTAAAAATAPAAAPAAAAPAAAAPATADAAPGAAAGEPATAEAPAAAAAYDTHGDDDTLYDACDAVVLSPPPTGGAVPVDRALPSRSPPRASPPVEEIPPATVAVASTPAASRVAWADAARQRSPAGRPVRRTHGGLADAATAAAVAAAATVGASAAPATSAGAVAPLAPATVSTAAAAAARVVGAGGATQPGDTRLAPQLPLPDGVYRGCNITVVLRPTAASEPLMDAAAAAAAAASAAAAKGGDAAATAGGGRVGRRSLDAPPVGGAGGGRGGRSGGGGGGTDTRRSCQLPDGRRRRVRLGISSKVSAMLWRE